MKNTSKTKIVLTGAPSTGKSSVLKELARVYGDKVSLVPESAVVLLSGGFPPPSHTDHDQIRLFQQAILKVQEGLEFIIPRQPPEADFMVFDRGSLDGAGFWPPGVDDFLKSYQVDKAREYGKFHHVLFLELPRPELFGGINELRFHNFEQSLASEKQLHQVWKDHPSFTRIPAYPTLEEKVAAALSAIKKLIT